MADTVSLELLSAELQIQIMKRVDTIDALHAVICASPRLYQVFRFNEEQILSRIARQGFHPTAVLEALSVARLSIWGYPLPKEKAMAFLRTPLKDRKQRLFATTPVSESVALCKLEKRIRFFVEDYTRETLPILGQLALSQDLPIATDHNADHSKNTVELSMSEFGRLQRAFCRYELYSRLFAQCSGEFKECRWSNTTITAEEQTQLFLQKYRPFEIAEIHCVRDYLHRRLRGIYAQVEDEAVDMPQPEYFDQGNRCATGRKSCPWTFRYYGGSGQEGHREHLASLGLPYLRRILEAAGNERRDLIFHGAYTCCGGIPDTGFITEALGPRGLERRGQGRMLKLVNAQEELQSLLSQHEEELVPPGWLWYCADRDFVLPADNNCQGLRAWGYVFWDHSRLSAAGILNRE